MSYATTIGTGGHDMELHKQIKAYRQKLQLSQEDLADKIYVTRQSISNWETGKNYPDIHSLILMSSLFHVSLDELIKGDVELMKEELKIMNKEQFEHDSRIFAVLFFGFMLCTGPAVYFFKLYGAFAMVCLVIIMLIYALKVEKHKKNYDIQSYKEIIAFTNGETLDEITKQREIGKRGYQQFLLAIGSGILMFILTFGILKILSLLA